MSIAGVRKQAEYIRSRGLTGSILAEVLDLLADTVEPSRPGWRLTPEQFGGKADGVTDNAKAFEKLEASLQNSFEIVFGSGTYLTSRPLTIANHGVSILGRGGRSGSTTIRANFNGTALRASGRSLTVKGVQIAAGLNRLSGHGLHIEPPDMPNASISQVTLEDVAVVDQPGSGVIIAGQAPYSRISQLHAFRNKGHGLVIDDGTYSGRSNRDVDPGIVNISLCQFINNYGHGFVLGNPANLLPPYRILAENIELNDNATDSAVRFTDHQAYINAVSSEIVLCAFGNTGYVSVPNGGLYIKGDNLSVREPRLVTLSAGIEVGTNSRAIAIERPRIYKGRWSSNIPVAIAVPSNAQDIDVNWPNSMRFNADIYVGEM